MYCRDIAESYNITLFKINHTEKNIEETLYLSILDQIDTVEYTPPNNPSDRQRIHIPFQCTFHETLSMLQTLVVHIFNIFSTWEAEASRYLSSRLVWSTECVLGQAELHRETFYGGKGRKNVHIFITDTISKLYFCSSDKELVCREHQL